MPMLATSTLVDEVQSFLEYKTFFYLIVLNYKDRHLASQTDN